MKIIFSCCTKRNKTNKNKNDEIQHVSPIIMSASSIASSNDGKTNIKKVNLSLSISGNAGSTISSLKNRETDVGGVQASQILGGQESLRLSPVKKGEADVEGVQASQMLGDQGSLRLSPVKKGEADVEEVQASQMLGDQESLRLSPVKKGEADVGRGQASRISQMQGDPAAIQSQVSDIQKLQLSNREPIFSIDNQPKYGWQSEWIVYNPAECDRLSNIIFNKNRISDELKQKIGQRVKEYESKYGDELHEFYSMLKLIVKNNNVVIPYVGSKQQHAILTNLKELDYRVRKGEYKYTRAYVLNQEAKAKAKIVFNQVGLYSQVVASNINNIVISAIEGFYKDLDESGGKGIDGFDIVDTIMEYLKNEKCLARRGCPSDIQLVLQHALHPGEKIKHHPFIQVYFDQQVDFNSVSEVWLNADGDEVKESTSDARYHSTTGMWDLDCGFGSEGVIYSGLAQTLVEYLDKGKIVRVFNCKNPESRVKKELGMYEKHRYAFDERMKRTADI